MMISNQDLQNTKSKISTSWDEYSVTKYIKNDHFSVLVHSGTKVKNAEFTIVAHSGTKDLIIVHLSILVHSGTKDLKIVHF